MINDHKPHLVNGGERERTRWICLAAGAGEYCLTLIRSPLPPQLSSQRHNPPLRSSNTKTNHKRGGKKKNKKNQRLSPPPSSSSTTTTEGTPKINAPHNPPPPSQHFNHAHNRLPSVIVYCPPSDECEWVAFCLSSSACVSCLISCVLSLTASPAAWRLMGKHLSVSGCEPGKLGEHMVRRG